ncbi:hypothetical protein C1645_836424 [Glomus cerebriforme]|uniref:Uncharacterized protein n=1 Tax=Glomus cerebriforme TaxID=658196 RepID=A0A397S5V8_9GLOM|nr:hypothetical protein C1645_836424 [Glomus cerebriforme]
MISAIPDSRANSSFSYITSRTSRPRLIPLSPKDNTMNIGHNIYNTSQYNFNMTDESVPSPFNEMTIYQLCIEWIHTANRHFGDFHNKLVNSVIDLINNFKKKSNLANPLQKKEIITFVDESVTVHVLSQWLNTTNMEEL